MKRTGILSIAFWTLLSQSHFDLEIDNGSSSSNRQAFCDWSAQGRFSSRLFFNWINLTTASVSVSHEHHSCISTSPFKKTEKQANCWQVTSLLLTLSKKSYISYTWSVMMEPLYQESWRFISSKQRKRLTMLYMTVAKVTNDILYLQSVSDPPFLLQTSVRIWQSSDYFQSPLLKIFFCLRASCLSLSKVLSSLAFNWVSV